MYCIKCGVELADSERICPLCGLKVYHPELDLPKNIEYPYPKFERTNEQVTRFGLMMVLTLISFLPIILTLICNISISGMITWSSFVIGGILTFYLIFLLPMWFKRPNPVIFVPIDFGIVALLLLYIALLTSGNWFLPFGLPIVLGLGIIVTTVVTLIRYLKRGILYIIGGAIIALGAFTVLIDHLVNVTFNTGRGIFWSWYPLTVLTVLGLIIIFIAICKPLKETIKRKFFI